MKSLFGFFAVTIAITALPTFVTADAIDSAIVNDGTNDITLLGTTPGNAAPPFTTRTNFAVGSDALLQSFTSGGVAFDTLIAADAFVNPDADIDVLAASGTADADFPTLASAVTDFDLVTGSLNTFAGNALDAAAGTNEFFDFSSQTITDETVFFAFYNETLGSVGLVDSDGVFLTELLTSVDQGQSGSSSDETQLVDLTLAQIGGDDLTGRELLGSTFAVSEFTFTNGATLADVAGFSGVSSAADLQSAGIAVATAVPEPSSAILLVGGLGVFLARRRRK